MATSEYTYATLNLYPYNGGHIMILPYRHVGDITDFSTRRASGPVRQPSVSRHRASVGDEAHRIQYRA